MKLLSESRREFLGRSALVAATSFLSSDFLSAQQRERPQALKPDLVEAFVRAGHVDLDRVKELLSQEPGLLNASWDWGGGDFEMALGGAGHMGRRDIAEFLIGQGARMDIFVAAMLGKVEIVESVLGAFPELKSSKGPHGLTLTFHAQKGGEAAQKVLKLLQAVGAS